MNDGDVNFAPYAIQFGLVLIYMMSMARAVHFRLVAIVMTFVARVIQFSP